MGIYVFDTEYLLNALSHDREEIDFGMHIIPRAIEEKQVYAYPFYGYWRDVGTIRAYWDANMDILRADSGISPEEWGIRPNTEADGRAMDRVPARFLPGCTVRSSMISAGSIIEGTVLNSVLSPGVIVRKGAVVRDSIILEDSVIEAGAEVDLTICDKRVHIGAGSVIGHGDDEAKKVVNQEYPTHLYSGISLIGKAVQIPQNMRIGRNCIIRPGKKGRDERIFPAELQHGDIF